MPEHDLLRDVVAVLAAALPILLVFGRLRIPPSVGFLVSGVVFGPHALRLVHDPGRVEELADLGVVLILFFVGMEFPLDRLKRLGRAAVVGGALQMTFAALAAAAILMLVPASTPRRALFGGLLVAVSSTAVVLPVLTSRDEVDAPHSRQFLAVSLFQDLAVIPLILLLPALSEGAGAPPALEVAGKVLFAVVGVALLVGLARTVVPHVLGRVARVASREVFTAAVLVVVLGIVSLASRTGVSAAMGAFAAGIVVAESEWIADVSSLFAPYRDVFSALFFVSIGMLVDPRFLLRHVDLLAWGVPAVIVVKVVTAYPALRIAGAVPRTALQAAVLLSGVGEFAFVLAGAGRELGLLPADRQQGFVAVAVVSLILVPLLASVGPRLAALLPDRVGEVSDGGGHAVEPASGHVLVIGYGLNGRNVARVLRQTRIKVVVLEADFDRVREARRDGIPVLLADAAGSEALIAAGMPRARAVVVTVADPSGSRRIVRLCRSRNRDASIVVRTRYVREVDELRRAGADEVIPEEFETSLEIVGRVLRSLHVPGNIVATQLRLLRDEGYRILRDDKARVQPGRRLSALVAAGTSELFLVMPDTRAAGTSLADLDLASDNVAVPALLREGEPLVPPPQDEPLQPGDTLLLVGAHEDLVHAIKKLEETRASEE